MTFYDGLLHIGKPAYVGMPKAAIYYQTDLWPTTDRTQPPSGYVRKDGEIAVLDIEVWPWWPNDWWVQTVKNFREIDPGSRLGFYGFPDANRLGNFRDLDQQSATVAKVRADHDSMPFLSRESDILTPTLYTRSNDIEQWVVTAVRTIKEAKRIGEACIPFIWFDHHDTYSATPGAPVPAELWRVQLEICRSYADGAIIWGGYKKQWDENAEWLRILREFL